MSTRARSWSVTPRPTGCCIDGESRRSLISVSVALLQLFSLGAVKPQGDACALLTAREVVAVAGGAFKESKTSSRSEGGFTVSQCFYQVDPFSGSVSLEVTRRAAAGAAARDPRAQWQEMFHAEKAERAEKAEKAEKEDASREGEEREARGHPEPVAGLAEEAFWVASGPGGALFALKGNAFLRISAGGRDDHEGKLRKCRRLAEKALRRM